MAHVHKIILIKFLVKVLNFYVVLSLDCSSSQDNVDYMGAISLTKSNQTCQSWSDFFDFYQGTYSLNFVDSLEDAKNFCRNPTGDQQKDKAWCYTNIANKLWEYCDIPKCTGCSKVHGIAHGSLQLINQNFYPDESFRPGTQIKFSCNENFAVYDKFSGPLTWTCTDDAQWSASELPKCLWRGFMLPSAPTPNCWYYSQTQFYKNSSPRRLYYGTENTNKNGVRCLNWINAQQYSDVDFPQEGKSNALNYCRSPDDYEPKCFVNNYQDLTSCDIPKCRGCAAAPFIKYTSFSIDYQPDTQENTVKEKSIIRIRCSVGNLVGSNILTCKNGIWDKDLPMCSVKFCSEPPYQPANSFISYRRLTYANIEDFGKEYLTYDGSIYIIQCQKGYQFSDSSVSQLSYECNSGEWILSGSLASCVQEGETTVGPPISSKYCRAPSDVENGYRKQSSIKKAGPDQYYGQFEIDCYLGYSLRGDPIVRCVDGSWSTYPTCTIGASCSLDIISKPAVNVNIISSNLLYNADQTGIAVGSYVIYECLPNYYPEFSEADLNVKCLENGQWSSKIPIKCVY